MCCDEDACARRSINYLYNNAQVVRRLIKFSLTLLHRHYSYSRDNVWLDVIHCCLPKFVHWTFHTLWSSSEWGVRNASGSTVRCDSTKCVLVHIDWKVNCIFEKYISLVHIENFVSSALHIPHNYEKRCERCLWLLLCEKCCVPWCRQFILCIHFPWTRFFAQCHLD